MHVRPSAHMLHHTNQACRTLLSAVTSSYFIANSNRRLCRSTFHLCLCLLLSKCDLHPGGVRGVRGVGGLGGHTCFGLLP